MASKYFYIAGGGSSPYSTVGNWYLGPNGTGGAAGSIPTAGDTIYQSNGTMTFTTGVTIPNTGNGITIASNLTVSGLSTTSLVLGSGVVVNAGVTITDSSNLMLFTVGSSTSHPVIFMGDMILSGFGSGIFLAAGKWEINNGAAGGSLIFTNVGTSGSTSTITLQSAASGQVMSFSNLTLDLSTNTLYSFIDVTGLPVGASAWKLTGALTINQYTGLVAPTGNWLVLTPAAGSNLGSTSAFGVTVAHVPALGAILTTDNLFGAIGTVVLPTAGQVANGVAFGPGGSLTGSFSSAPVGIVVGG